MTVGALLFMVFICSVCLGGFIYSLYLSSKSK